jgi:hypothetical protein
MSNKFLSRKIPIQYRGMPMMAGGFVAMVLTFLIPFNWTNFVAALAMIIAGPAMFAYGKMQAKKTSQGFR